MQIYLVVARSMIGSSFNDRTVAAYQSRDAAQLHIDQICQEIDQLTERSDYQDYRHISGYRYGFAGSGHVEDTSIQSGDGISGSIMGGGTLPAFPSYSGGLLVEDRRSVYIPLGFTFDPQLPAKRHSTTYHIVETILTRHPDEWMENQGAI